jgi:hypothetical protein
VEPLSLVGAGQGIKVAENDLRRVANDDDRGLEGRGFC